MFKKSALAACCITILWAANAAAMGYSNLSHYSYYNRQRVHKLSINKNIVYSLNTAYGFISVITLPVIPLNIAIGNSAAYAYNVLGNQIFVKPLSYNKKISTNMEILTKYGLLNILIRITNKKDVAFNLNLASPDSGMFYKNYIAEKLRVLESKLQNQYMTKYRTITAMKKQVAANKLYVQRLILSINKKKIDISGNKAGVSFTVLYASRIGSKYYIRYMISNSTDNYVALHDLYLYTAVSSWYGASSKKEDTILNPPANLKLMPREVYKGVIVYKNKTADEVSAHFFINGKLEIIRVQL